MLRAAMTTQYHDTACILSTGDEVTLGQIVDANAAWLADALTSAGVLPVEQATVPDDAEVIGQTIRRLAQRAPLIVMSGGLGPTDADLTRPAMATLAGEELVVDDEAMAALTELLGRRGRVVTDRQARQATRPASARCLPNPFGTAPGLHVRLPAGRTGAPWDADVFCLPGPPRELQPMFRDCVLPSLRLDPALATRTRLLHVLAVPESDVAARLAHLTRRQDVGEAPLLAMTASGGILTLRARIRTSAGESAAAAALDTMEREIRSVLGHHVMPGHAQVGTRGESALASCVVQQLRQSGRSLSVAESCTGGMIGGLVTSISGSSASFVGGVITYSNELKARLLGVSQSDLATHGAVSEPVARAMAIGAIKLTGASDALSVTGIAGPDGGSQVKPVGTVFLGHARREDSGEVRSAVRQCLVTGDRHDVRQRAAISALSMLYFAQAMGFEESRAVRLNWQVGT